MSLPINDQQKALLAPVVTLVLWTFVMEVWMYAQRISAFPKYKINYGPNSLKVDLDRQVPGPVRWPADNYNHLHEQPTIFYAVALTLVILSGGSEGMAKVSSSYSVPGTTSTDVRLAWLYVGIRVVHSLIHSIGNPIMPRFWVFLSSSFTLLGLAVRTAIPIFS